MQPFAAVIQCFSSACVAVKSRHRCENPNYTYVAGVYIHTAKAVSVSNDGKQKW